MSGSAAKPNDIHSEDRRICRAIGEHGRVVDPTGCIGVLTHCNAGALAVSELGTATAPLYLAFEAGVPFRVFVDETRPSVAGCATDCLGAPAGWSRRDATV